MFTFDIAPKVLKIKIAWKVQRQKRIAQVQNVRE